MAELELGNLMFNTNKNQMYSCPNWVIALLREIDRTLYRVKYNMQQSDYDSPFDNTGNVYYNDVFEVQAYNWDDDTPQEYNFKWKDVKISWYKYLGRDTTINGQYEDSYLIKMFNECIESLHKINDKYLEELENGN